MTVWQQLREAAVPVVAYWACLLFAFASFCAVVLFTDGLSGENLLALGVIAASTLPGAALGQLFAFLRVRGWILLAFGAACWAAAFGLGLAMAAAGSVAALVFLVLFLLPIALTGGLWSLDTHRALWATWLPLLFTTASVLVWSEWRNTDASWFAGQKWAIWDLATLGVLGGTIGLLLLYLVSRETHRLALWRRGPRAPLQPSMKEKGAARPRLTILGGLVLGGLALALTGATAVVSPYLWRTGPGDEPDDDPVENPQPQEPQQPDDGDGGDSKLLQAIEEVVQKMAESAQEASGAVCSALTFFVLGALLFAAFYRPLRRLFLLRHLRDPFWAVPATTRIEHGWRLVEIALADAGVYPRPGEDAAGLARRARPVLEKLSPVEVHGLEDAAEVADRVRFGLGVAPEDVAVMTRFAGWAIDTVWERLDDRQQVAAMYRGI